MRINDIIFIGGFVFFFGLGGLGGFGGFYKKVNVESNNWI